MSKPSRCSKCNNEATILVSQVGSRGLVLMSEALCDEHAEMERNMVRLDLSMTAPRFEPLPVPAA